MGGMPGTVRGEMTKWPPAAAQPEVGSFGQLCRYERKY